MPKEGAMTQISRPFQIALLAMGLFAAVWFIALQGHSTSTSSSSSSPSAPAATPAAGSSAAVSKAAAPSPVYHGAAPGVEGLSRAIAKAHEAVATSNGAEKALAEKSAQASSASSTGITGASAPGSAPAAAAAPATAAKGATTTHAATSHTVKVHVRVTHSAPATKVAPGAASTKSTGTAKSVPPNQAMVESELKQGKIVAVLFWNAKASVDRTVQHELQAVGHTLGGKLAVHDARAVQVGSFGSITRDVQVFATPTILIVNKHGHTTTLTGLADSFSITQAIAEARTA
jgi:hypothetical protein